MFKFFSSIYIKKMALLSSVAIFLIILDRFLKVWATYVWSITPLELSSWFSLDYSLNDSLAFSLPANKYFIITVIILLLFVLTATFLKDFKNKNSQAVLWFSIILGASSNLIDRLLYGAVIDYLSLAWFTTFNLADCLIVVSVAILLLQEFFPRASQLDAYR
jgi:signal peptidase II